MLGSIAKYVKDVSVVRRLLFASASLPQDLPNMWGIAVEFATRGKESRNAVTPQQAKLLVENLRELDSLAFASDRQLLQELVEFQVNKLRPMGVVLISSNNSCLLCKSRLQLRKDRPAPVVIYDDDMGTVPGTHFHKYCTSLSCGFVQHYGYYTNGPDTSATTFNTNWSSLPYFVSSRETVFSMKLLHQVNANIVIGQLSFKQCADVYNFTHEYTTDL